MARFYGKVGFGETVETPSDSGVFVDLITEKEYYGDEVRVSRKSQEGENLNYDLSVNTSISIVADAYANEHIYALRYVEWQGQLWTVPTVEVDRPRLILRIGEVYNGPLPIPVED